MIKPNIMIKQTIARIFILCVLLFLSLITKAQNTSILEEAARRFNEQVTVLPQEKIYIQTDKNHYIAGENIFMRAHLVDAKYHLPVAASRYVYVELINPMDSVVQRLKLRPEETRFFGQMSLPDYMAEGNYRLRSYTQFMRNIDEEYFFSKAIYISDPNSSRLQVETKTEFETDSKIRMEIRMEDIGSHTSILPEEISIRINNEAPKTIRKGTDAYRFTFNLSPNSKQRVAFLETTYRGYYYKKYIPIPYPEQYHVSFFPEGGNLLVGTDCVVAFKVVGSDGLQESITGVVYDSKNNPVAHLSSIHSGMGLFSLNAHAGEKYYAICQNSKGMEMRFDLPAPMENSYALRTTLSQGQLLVNINKSSSAIDQSFYLLMHTQGELLFTKDWGAIDEPLLFDQSLFPSGILHLLLLNNDMKIVSERLVFINNDDQAEVKFEFPELTYKARQHVELDMGATFGGQALVGSFSVAVTDDKVVSVDSTSNILTNLLLTSELRGTIENPASYFDASDRRNSLKLNMLMMTQGWRRYDVPSVLEGNLSLPKYELETSQKISGKVQNAFFQNKSKNARLSILSMDLVYSDETTSDDNGRFAFDGFDMPDSTFLVIQALSKGESNRVILTLDKETFPEITSRQPFRVELEEEQIMEYIRKEEEKYIMEKGIRVIDLDEVVVTGKKQVGTRSKYTSFSDNSITMDDIANRSVSNIKTLLDRFGSVSVDSNGNISIRGKSPVLLFVNDVEMDNDFLNFIQPDDVLRIDLILNGSFFGLRGANGVISISTKSLEGIAKKEKFNIAYLSPLGFNRPIEFYSPVYDTPEAYNNPNPDNRTTVFWKPDVVLDENGKAAFDFYTADGATTYTILIEGVSNEGKIIYYKGKIENSQ